MRSEIVDIRHFQARDFTALLESESRLWGANLRWDYTPSAQLISTCLEEKRLSGYALVNESRIKGYCFFFCEGEKGLIGDLFVEPDGAALDEALLLLEHVIETLTGTPGLRRVEAQLPHFGFEELEPFLCARGFEAYLRRFMAVTLASRPSPPQPSGARRSSKAHGELVLSDAFLIEPWEGKHGREAAQLLSSTYRNHVDAIINNQYGSVEGATRLIENILHHRGCGEHLPQVSRVAIHRATRKFAGFLVLTTVRPGTAHIPQVAIAKEFQGRGLGTAMMEAAFAQLARQGYQEVSLTVTDLNTAAVRLYERLGFETFRRFGAFVWTLGFEKPSLSN